MTTRLNPYLGFADNAREALDFYHSVFGGELTTSTFGEFQASEDATEAGKIMHGQLIADSGFTLMAADTPNRMPYSRGQDFSVSLSGDGADEAELRGYWDKLLDDGSQTVPLEKAPWGDTFGMLTDKFGVKWLVNIAG